MQSALTSLTTFAEGLKDEWHTALTSAERKRRAIMSPNGNNPHHAADTPPAFSEPQKEALSFSVNAVLHRAFTDFNTHLDTKITLSYTLKLGFCTTKWILVGP